MTVMKVKEYELKKDKNGRKYYEIRTVDLDITGKEDREYTICKMCGNTTWYPRCMEICQNIEIAKRLKSEQ